MSVRRTNDKGILIPVLILPVLVALSLSSCSRLSRRRKAPPSSKHACTSKPKRKTPRCDVQRATPKKNDYFLPFFQTIKEGIIIIILLIPVVIIIMGDYYGRASASGDASTPKASRAAAPASGGLDQGKIFVGGLSWQTTEESLRWHFEQYGPVASVDVMKDRVTGDPRGFAFVIFQDGATVDLVMAEANHEINHKIVDVKRAQARGVAPPSIHGGEGKPEGEPSSQPSQGNHGGGGGGGGNHMSPEQQGTKVFVGGIPPSVDRDELKKIFEEFGPVVDAIVMVDQATNRSRCFGFVTFEHGSDGAHKVIERQPLNIQGRNVEVKLATPKADQRRAPPAAGPKHVGLRAGMASTSTGEYAGLSVSYGRNGWKAGYGTYAFGKAGWAVQGWEDMGNVPDKSGFSFSMVKEPSGEEFPPPKKARLEQ